MEEKTFMKQIQSVEDISNDRGISVLTFENRKLEPIKA